MSGFQGSDPESSNLFWWRTTEFDEFHLCVLVFGLFKARARRLNPKDSLIHKENSVSKVGARIEFGASLFQPHHFGTQNYELWSGHADAF